MEKSVIIIIGVIICNYNNIGIISLKVDCLNCVVRIFMVFVCVEENLTSSFVVSTDP